MSRYYFMGQLPSLDGIGNSMPLPIAEAEFLSLCAQYLRKKEVDQLRKLTWIPPKKTTKTASPLLRAWNNGERALRLALARVRAERMQKPLAEETEEIPKQLQQTAHTIANLRDPMQAEQELNRYRLTYLESLRPLDPFAEDYIFYYALRLKLLLRIRQFDTERGEAAYRSIYNSILQEETTEGIP